MKFQGQWLRKSKVGSRLSSVRTNTKNPCMYDESGHWLVYSTTYSYFHFCTTRNHHIQYMVPKASCSKSRITIIFAHYLVSAMIILEFCHIYFSLTLTGISARLAGFSISLGPGILYGSRPISKKIKLNLYTVSYIDICM
jgi:hypothetical protein